MVYCLNNKLSNYIMNFMDYFCYCVTLNAKYVSCQIGIYNNLLKKKNNNLTSPNIKYLK